jgi:hypothetical protein
LFSSIPEEPKWQGLPKPELLVAFLLVKRVLLEIAEVPGEEGEFVIMIGMGRSFRGQKDESRRRFLEPRKGFFVQLCGRLQPDLQFPC